MSQLNNIPKASTLSLLQFQSQLLQALKSQLRFQDIPKAIVPTICRLKLARLGICIPQKSEHAASRCLYCPEKWFSVSTSACYTQLSIQPARHAPKRLTRSLGPLKVYVPGGGRDFRGWGYRDNNHWGEIKPEYKKIWLVLNVIIIILLLRIYSMKIF